MGHLSLRPATEDDAEFLDSVYASTRAEELALTDWSAGQKALFCRMQSGAQAAHYSAHYPAAEYWVIEHAGAASGRLYVTRSADAIHIIDIALLPDHRRQGIGSHLLRQLMNEASAGGKVLTIHVERFNPALRLYERLGFRIKEEAPVYLLMEWRSV